MAELLEASHCMLQWHSAKMKGGLDYRSEFSFPKKLPLKIYVMLFSTTCIHAYIMHHVFNMLFLSHALNWKDNLYMFKRLV
jgi:hypothetical protein